MPYKVAVRSMCVVLALGGRLVCADDPIPEHVRPDYDMDPWLVQATRSDDWAEPAAVQLTTATKPLEAVADGRPFALTTATLAQQPSGALSGKIIYLMGGHGRTYNEEPMRWITQRSPMNDMVEDYGNQDQSSSFAELAFNAGATLVPLRPFHEQPIERVVDNASPQCELFGDWLGGTSKIAYAAGTTVPYVFARMARTETAIARFRPYLPEDGFYPVYGWARDGKDRGLQTYRVFHTGGATEVKVDHRRVGRGWIYLGSYYFAKGWNGFVEVTNQATDPYDADLGRFAIADAIRFGNGRGDRSRPGGISGQTRAEEGNVYWLAESLGGLADRRLTNGVDRSLTVGAPPRSAAYLNRETEGRFTDRLYVSFHSNASKSRGSVGLWNKDPRQRPDFQQALAELTGRAVNDGMRLETPAGLPPWGKRTANTTNWITFGELRKDALQNEMCATIIETAYFDQADDARWLTDARGQFMISQASLQGILQWFSAAERNAAPILMPPPMPTDVTAEVTQAGDVRVAWSPGKTGPVRGGDATQFFVQTSPDGRGFGVSLDARTDRELIVKRPADRPVTAPLFLRVVAANSAGRSMPTGAIGVRGPADLGTSVGVRTRDILFVDAFDAMDSRMNLKQIESFQEDPESMKSVDRVRPVDLMRNEGFVRVLEAAGGLGLSYDTAAAGDVVAGKLPLDRYKTIVWWSGPQPSDSQPMSTAGAGALSQFVGRGGKVLALGAHLAEGLSDGAEGAELLRRVFGARVHATPNTSPRFVTATGPAAWSHGAPTSAVPLATSFDALVPENNGREVLRWKATGAGAAAVRGPGGTLATVALETIPSLADRQQVLSILLN